MSRKIPSLQALTCFDAAARHESYTRAAQELSLTQSAVSRQITALETFLGVALFKRTRHGVALTRRGAEYAVQIAPRLQALEQDTLDVMSAHGGGGALHLAAVPTFATRWLIPRLPLLAASHPDITVHIETRTRPFMFAESPFDAALYAGTAEQVASWVGTQALRLLPDEVLPVCSPTLMAGLDALEPEAMARMPLLQQSTRLNAWRQWFDAAGVSAPQALAGPRYELFSMTAAAAAQGMGLALVPRLLIDAELARGELVIANAQMAPGQRSYFLVRPAASETPNPTLDAFAGWIMAVA